MSDRRYAKTCCGHHHHETIAEALACERPEIARPCGRNCFLKEGRCENVRALTWAFGDWTFVGLTPNESNELGKLTNPGWWDKHHPGWRDKEKK